MNERERERERDLESRYSSSNYNSIEPQNQYKNYNQMNDQNDESLNIGKLNYDYFNNKINSMSTISHHQRPVTTPHTPSRICHTHTNSIKHENNNTLPNHNQFNQTQPNQFTHFQTSHTPTNHSHNHNLNSQSNYNIKDQHSQSQNPNNSNYSSHCTNSNLGRARNELERETNDVINNRINHSDNHNRNKTNSTNSTAIKENVILREELYKLELLLEKERVIINFFINRQKH